jgi:hypothetical protein
LLKIKVFIKNLLYILKFIKPFRRVKIHKLINLSEVTTSENLLSIVNLSEVTENIFGLNDSNIKIITDIINLIT